MVTGTSNFVSLLHAHQYYSQYGFTPDDVQRKLADGEISVGKPDTSIYEIIGTKEGRYWVKQKPNTAPKLGPKLVGVVLVKSIHYNSTQQSMTTEFIRHSDLSSSIVSKVRRYALGVVPSPMRRVLCRRNATVSLLSNEVAYDDGVVRTVRPALRNGYYQIEFDLGGGKIYKVYGIELSHNYVPISHRGEEIE